MTETHKRPPRGARITARGRGTSDNPPARFERFSAEAADEHLNACALEDPEGVQVPVQTITDTSRTIIATNDSPDVGMDTTLNPYRGCEHGCIYCYARPTHEYLGLSAGLDFETKIHVKENAALLLREKLSSARWVPRIVTLSGITDCYQPVEKRLRITRACLELLQQFQNPAAIITKNALIERDIDLLQAMAAWNGIAAHISITSLDSKLARKMEPRASQPALRLRAIESLAKAGVPVSVIIGPVIPGLTDQEIPAILKAAADAGASGAHYTMLRLPHAVKDLFQHWLDDHYPDRAERVLSHVRDVRGGKLNSSTFGERMRGKGPYADQIEAMFALYRRRYGLNRAYHSLSAAHFRRPQDPRQPDLFGCCAGARQETSCKTP
jgi:DNA repair photolyase